MAAALVLGGCGDSKGVQEGSDIRETVISTEEPDTESENLSMPRESSAFTETEEESSAVSTETEPEEETAASAEEELPEISLPESEMILWNGDWEYADYSAIHDDSAVLYYSHADVRKEKIICINAGHGTLEGSKYKTLCHPDGSVKVTGGSTSKGATEAICVSSGTTMLDGTPEGTVTLMLALTVKEQLLEDGYDVLMVREDEDVQLDNIARTVMANNNADCHISLHYDSTESDKGLFYISVPDVASYRAMEPVAFMWEEHMRLGEALLTGMTAQEVRLYGSGSMAIDLTQTSYSTVPSVDLEVGDRASDYGDSQLQKLARGISAGLDEFFGME